MSTTSIFFNHSFDKKRLKTFIYWVLKTFGEKEALAIVEQLKSMGFNNATKAGLSIGLHDLKTPSKKRFLISRAQITMNKTDQEFRGAEVTATERSQRIVDTWHRTSEDLRKQVVDYFSTYDQLNSVYMMALSGARGNFSQVRQLIGMRGLMADPQGQIISFPIRSNLREGLTLTEYFISCSGARKGLVDTALRTADTGYLTRRLVDISHHVVVKKVSCYTSRGIALKTLRTSQKILLPLRDRLVGRVLAENIYVDSVKLGTKQTKQGNQNKKIIARKNQEISPDLALKISSVRPCKNEVVQNFQFGNAQQENKTEGTILFCNAKQQTGSEGRSIVNISTPQASEQVLVRSPLTCTYTHEVCQLCYGWSMAQGSLVSLGEAVGVIAGQSIGEPGTQLTMRTFHTGGVFSGDLLQEIRAPHSGKILFPKALQGLLIRTSQGKIAFLIKVSGELLVENTHIDGQAETNKTTKLPLAPSTILFVRQGEKVKSNQILAELAITTEEGNQPIKSRQTLFSEMRGRIVQWKSMISRTHTAKGVQNQRLTNSKAVSTGVSLRCKMLVKAKPSPKPFYNALRAKPKAQWKFNSRYKSEAFVTGSTFLQRLQPSKQGFANRALLFYTEGKQVPFDNKNKAKREQSFHHYQERWGHLDALTIKKIVIDKKHGLASVEPPQALKLGLLSVIAVRVGASEKTSAKLCLDTHMFGEGEAFTTRLQHLNTVAKEGDLVDENYNKLSFRNKVLRIGEGNPAKAG